MTSHTLLFSQNCDVSNIVGFNGTWSMVNCNEYHGQQFTTPNSGGVLNSIIIYDVIDQGGFPYDINVSFSLGNNTLNPSTTFQTTILQAGQHIVSLPVPVVLLPNELYSFSFNNPNDNFGCSGGVDFSIRAVFANTYSGGNVFRESNGSYSEFPFDFGFSLDIDCCPIQYVAANKLSGVIINNGKYQAEQKINSCQEISNTVDFEYTAGNEIVLDSGFKTTLGIQFHAFIAGCN